MKAELLNYFGNDLMVVNAARVSYGKSKDVFDEKDEKLIKYLVTHKHIAPFRHPQLQFRIECPIFVERQLFKHQVGLCLSGDTEITFVNSSKGLSRVKLSDLYDRWEKGRPHQNSPKDSEYSKRRIKYKKLRILNETTGIFEIGHIKDIFFSGEKEIYKITLENGKTLKCSKDHRIFTKNGWMNISGGLKVGFMVGCNGIKVVGNGMYRDREYLKKLKDDGYSVSEMAEMCGCGYHNIRKWLKIHGLSFDPHQTYFKLGHIPWNKGVSGYSIECSPRTNTSYLTGANSHFWKGGVTSERGLIGKWTRNNSKKIHDKYNYTCQKCGISSGKLHAHHIIPVVQDISKAYDLDNLITVCGSCHSSIHKSIENEMEFANFVLDFEFKPFEYNKKLGENRYGFKTRVHYSKIVSIEKIGVEKTYDIEVEGVNHNFVANGIVVHNSANSISGRYVDFSDSYWLPTRLRLQSKDSKQGSAGYLDEAQNEMFVKRMKELVDQAASLYDEMSNANIAKEQCRVILPLSLQTQFIWTGSLLAFTHFWNLRLKADTQEETRIIANQMLELVKNIDGNPFQYTIKAFDL